MVQKYQRNKTFLFQLDKDNSKNREIVVFFALFLNDPDKSEKCALRKIIHN